MAVNETIVTNRYFRKCTDAANKVWQRISFWHKASDCEFDDGSTAQTKVGAIKGITTSTSVTETGYAADMTTVKGFQTQIDELNSNLGETPVFDQEINTYSGVKIDKSITAGDYKHIYVKTFNQWNTGKQVIYLNGQAINTTTNTGWKHLYIYNLSPTDVIRVYSEDTLQGMYTQKLEFWGSKNKMTVPKISSPAYFK